MPRSPEPPEPTGADGPPPWMGAPAYQPHPELPPHAPMPGAPPYPAREEHPPPPVGQAAAPTGFATVLAATAVWAVVNLVLILLVDGPAPSVGALAQVVGLLVALAAVTALLVWLAVRHRGWPFLGIVLVAAPCFFVLRALVNLLVVL